MKNAVITNSNLLDFEKTPPDNDYSPSFLKKNDSFPSTNKDRIQDKDNDNVTTKERDKGNFPYMALTEKSLSDIQEQPSKLAESPYMDGKNIGHKKKELPPKGVKGFGKAGGMGDRPNTDLIAQFVIDKERSVAIHNYVVF